MSIDGVLGVILLLQALAVAVSGPPTSSEYLPLRVADAEGYFEQEGVQVTLRSVRGEVAAAEALATGEVDVAATSLEAILRFGPRVEGRQARLLLGLTAAPPVALLVSARDRETVRSVRDLAGRRLGYAAPGAPEYAWLAGILAGAGLSVSRVDLVSLGGRRLASALESGDVQAALVHEPAASDLVRDGRARVLVDLHTPDAVGRALGAPTVNAAVFARQDRLPDAATLEGFVRAVLAAERQIASGPAATLAARLPPPVVGGPEAFARRVETTRDLYLPGGLVSPERLRATVALIRAHMPLPAAVKVPRAEEMIHDEPLRRASGSPAR
ncbi:MAG TPA: ABC transporter substrate-binding protein [Methylomirabilota bacterium]|nr:ABC transporter substrate-binding protein [Methylomirabilota bacterium]